MRGFDAVSDLHGPDAPGHAEDERAKGGGIIERLRHAFGLHSPSIRADIEEALDNEARPDGEFTPQERAILRNVLALHELRVSDIMIPRADIIAIGVEAPLREVLALFRSAAHSRLPVYGDTLDDPRGMVHIRDLVDHLAARAEGGGEGEALPALAPGAADLSRSVAAAGIMRPVLFIPPSMPALDLLVRMQATRTHMALVIDEYGGTDGLVSIEDVVEMIVGDIEDEHDEEEPPPIVESSPGAFTVDGRAEVAEVFARAGWPAPASDDDEVDTMGGLVVRLAGRVPARGEIVADDAAGIEYEVLEADPRRVKTLRLRRRAGDGPSGPAAAGGADETGAG